jgi:hypothetical protein
MSRTAWLGAVYRWGVLVLASVVWMRCFGEARMAEFGWQFRLLEVWAVSATALSTAFMVRLSMGWSRSPHTPFVGAVAAVNVVVVALHLGQLSPAPATSPGWHALSLLLVLPLLQIADALFVLGAFKRLRRAMAWVVAIAATYVAWVEMAVRPLNASSEGRGGLPYPILDTMPLADRLGFYVAMTGLALAVLPGLRVVQRRLRGERGGTSGDGIAA